MRKESAKIFLFIIFVAACFMIFTIENTTPQRQPLQAFLCIAIIGFSLLGIIDQRNEQQSTSENEQRNTSEMKSIVLGVGVILILTLVLISFSAFFAPQFFEWTGFTVNYTSNTGDPSLGTISAFDATNCFSSSIFTGVVAYIFWEMEIQKPKGK